MSKNFGKESPGPVNLDITSTRFDEFRPFPSELEDEYGFLNQYLYFNFKTSQDVKLVTEDCFKFFNSKYPGNEFKRPVLKIDGKTHNCCRLLRVFI